MTQDVKLMSMDVLHVGAFHSPSLQVYSSLLLFLLDDDLSITISSDLGSQTLCSDFGVWRA